MPLSQRIVIQQCLKIIVPMAKTNKFSLLTTFTPNNFNIHAHGKLKMLRLSESKAK